MDDMIIIPGGIRGTRKLAAALATLILRRCDKLDSYIPRYRLRKGPWGETEYKTALQLYARGKNCAEIGAVLRRTRFSVHSKIFRRIAA